MKPELMSIPLLGMNTSYKAPMGVADLVQDMRWDPRGAWRVAYGFEQAIDVTSEGAGGGSTPVLSMHWYETEGGGRRWHLIEAETDTDTVALYFWDLNSDSLSTLATNRYGSNDHWPGSQYAVLGDQCVICNGVDEPVRFDPWSMAVRRAGFTVKPPAPIILHEDVDDDTEDDAGEEQYDQYMDRAASVPPVTPAWSTFQAGGYYRAFEHRLQRGVGDRYPSISGGANVVGDPEAWYGYAITLMDEFGNESPPSEIIFTRVVTYRGSGMRSVPLQIRGAENDGVVRVRVWRTENLTPSNFTMQDDATTGNLTQMVKHVKNLRGIGLEDQLGFTQGQKLYLLADMPIGQGDIFYTDDKQDNELGPELNVDDTGLFPLGSMVSMFRGRLFVAGMRGEEQTKVRYSHALYRFQFPQRNALSVGGRHSGAVTCMLATASALFVATKRSIHEVRPSGDAFSASVLTDEQGCPSARGMQIVPGVGLCFINEVGIWVVSAGSPELLTKPIQSVWDERINYSAIARSWCMVDRISKEALWYVPADGDDRPTMALVLHYETGQWSIRVNYPFSCGLQTSDEKATIFCGSHDSSKGGVHVVGPGQATKGGDGLRGKYVTTWIRAGSEAAPNSLEHVDLFSLAYSGREVGIRWRRDRSLTWQAEATTMPTEIADQEGDWPTWSEGSHQGEWGSGSWGDYVPAVLRKPVTDNDGNMGMTFREMQVEVTGTKVALVAMNLRVAAKPEDDWSIRALDTTWEQA